MEGLVAGSLQERLGVADAPEVNLVSDPPPDMLLGKFEEGRITFTTTELGGVRPEGVTVDLEPFDLDVLGSVASGRAKSEGPLSGTLRMELPEEEVARIASSGALVPVRGVRLEEGYLVVESEVEVLGVRVPVGVEGELAVRDGELHFEPRRLEVLGAGVPDRYTRGLHQGAGFAYPARALPFEGEISGVEVHEDRLVLSGEVVLPTG